MLVSPKEQGISIVLSHVILLFFNTLYELNCVSLIMNVFRVLNRSNTDKIMSILCRNVEFHMAVFIGFFLLLPTSCLMGSCGNKRRGPTASCKTLLTKIQQQMDVGKSQW